MIALFITYMLIAVIHWFVWAWRGWLRPRPGASALDGFLAGLLFTSIAAAWLPIAILATVRALRLALDPEFRRACRDQQRDGDEQKLVGIRVTTEEPMPERIMRVTGLTWRDANIAAKRWEGFLDR